MSRISAILFDIDDTLYSTTAFAERARRNAVQAMIDMGLAVDPETALRELTEVIAEFSANYDHHYDKLLLRLPRSALGSLNPALVVAAGVIAYHETKFRQLRPLPDAEELLRTLHDRTDLVLGVVTEGLTIKQAEKIVRLGIHRYLDPRAIFISDQVGISKPNPKLYRHAAEALDLPASAVMVVGDNPEKDIEPARAVGMVTVRYRGTGKYAQTVTAVVPDHSITDHREILAILRDVHGIATGPDAVRAPPRS